MRDSKRIKPMLKMIEKIWLQSPDLRLMQLLGNAHGLRSDPYYVEDDKLKLALVNTYKDLL